MLCQLALSVLMPYHLSHGVSNCPMYNDSAPAFLCTHHSTPQHTRRLLLLIIFFFCYSVVVESYHFLKYSDILFPYTYLQVIIKLVTQTAICLRVQVFEQESLRKTLCRVKLFNTNFFSWHSIFIHLSFTNSQLRRTA